MKYLKINPKHKLAYLYAAIMMLYLVAASISIGYGISQFDDNKLTPIVTELG